MKTPIHWIACAFVGTSLMLATPVLAQATPSATGTTAAATGEQNPVGFWLTTPYPELTLAAGEAGNISLRLTNKGLAPQRAELSVAGLPAGWTSAFKGGGHDITAAMVALDDSADVTLQVTPPKGTDSGTYPFEVKATYANQTATLPIKVTLSAQKMGGVELAPDLPALSGTPSTTFSYRVKITNDSPTDAMFNLAADAPAGFTTTFKHGYGNDQITGLPIKAGANDTVTLDVKPNPSVSAGKYPVTMKVLAGDLTASTALSAQISGTPDLMLSGPQDRLSGQATAGQSTTFPFTVQNVGSAAASNLKLSASAPTGWTVTFDPSTLDSLAANATQKVSVKIQPSEKAIAGDYMVTLRANADGADNSVQFRVTVNTSTWWGIVGVAIIAVAVIVLVLAVLRYGRR